MKVKFDCSTIPKYGYSLHLHRETTEFGKSLINIINRREPRTEPWETPDVTGATFDSKPFTTAN